MTDDLTPCPLCEEPLPDDDGTTREHLKRHTVEEWLTLVNSWTIRAANMHAVLHTIEQDRDKIGRLLSLILRRSESPMQGFKLDEVEAEPICIITQLSSVTGVVQPGLERP